ncbi:Rab-GAP TBC domain-containing protein, partial [Haematococcus lacustris]
MLPQYYDIPAAERSEDEQAALRQDVVLSVEADCYWCLCKLVEGIQDHYTYAQPGIQRTVFQLQALAM